MKYLSLCSGIEAATAAWHPLGWTPVAFSEIEPYPSAVLQHHYPNVPNLGDMTKFHEWPADLNPDILVGGTPCQSFSVAGLRAGMDDPRGNLALTYLGIAERYRPRWIVWENVPGVLSSNGGRDFGSFLGALAKLGYGFCYRVLDAQFFGIAQQRRRVFVVGYFGDWRRAAAALFETPRVQRYSSESRRTRPQAAGGPAQDAGGGGVAGTIGRSYEKGHGRTGGANGGVAKGHLIPSAETSLCLNAGGMGRQDFETETMVVSAFTASAGGNDVKHAQASHIVAAPLTSAPYADRGAADESKLVPVPGSLIKHNELARKCRALEMMTPPRILPIPYPTPPGPPIPFDPVQITSPDNRSNPKPGSACHTLPSQEKPPCIAFEPRDRGDDGRGYARPPAMLEDIAPTVNATKTACVTPPPPAKERAGVRRLTCRECERLQGFPDDYTLIPWKNRRDPDDYAETVAYLMAAGWPEDEAKVLANTPDGPRYKAVGNSTAVPVMAWIGQQIALVDAIP